MPPVALCHISGGGENVSAFVCSTPSLFVGFPLFALRAMFDALKHLATEAPKSTPPAFILQEEVIQV